MQALSTFVLFIVFWLFSAAAVQANISVASEPPARLSAQYGKLPLSFEANQGQTDPSVRFLSRGPGYALFITPTEAVFSLRKARPQSASVPSGAPATARAARPTLFPGMYGAHDSSVATARAARPTPFPGMHGVHDSPVGRAARAIPGTPNIPPEPQRAPTETAQTQMLRMQLLGANPNARIAGLDELPGKVNYLRGNDPKQWRTGVATYGKVKLESIYDGVDLVYYGNGRQLEYDFIVAPHANPGVIRLNFAGAANNALVEGVSGAPYGASEPVLDARGDLLLNTPDGALRVHKPVIYQTLGGQRRGIDGGFVLHRERERVSVGFQVAAYDKERPLVIDPVLVYSSYLGGTDADAAGGDGGSGGNAIALDRTGNVYVTGSTYSSDFPTVNAKFPSIQGQSDAFITKLSADGYHVLYSTFLGGSSAWNDDGIAIAVDNAGNAYVTGITTSSDFPTMNAKYPHLRGFQDAFVTKLSADGQRILYSTYLGGDNADAGFDVAVDSIGNATIIGQTTSSDFPTVKAIYPNLRYEDAFVTRFSADGQKVLYSTYLGGSGTDWGYAIALDSGGSAYVTGATNSFDFPTINAKYTLLRGTIDAFITKIGADGQSVLYSTYLGGKNDWGYGYGWEVGYGIAVDYSGNAYVTGFTDSSDFPTVNAKYPQLQGRNDAFVTKLSADGQRVAFSTYLGGSYKEYNGHGDRGLAIAVDSAGSATVTGETFSIDFPTVNAKYSKLFGIYDAFVTRFSANGQQVLYSTYLGGNGGDTGAGIAVDGAGNAYVAGGTSSCDFPTAASDPKIISWDADCNGGGDAFVAKFGTSYLEITPNGDDFGLTPPNTVAERIFTIKNTANRALTGTLATTAPFSILSGASFTLAEGASQNVKVRFASTANGFFKAALKATGNFPAVSVPLTGIAAPAVKHVSVISSTVLQGAPGDAVTIAGRYFGPLPGELRIDGNPLAVAEWNDTFIRFTIPTLTSGAHTLTVVNAFGEASAPLQVLGNQPLISKLHPSNGAPGSMVVIEGFNFGATKGAGTLKVGGVDAVTISWSEQKIAFKIPALATGSQYPLELSTPSGTATKSLTVRNLFVYSKFGDCDKRLGGQCQPLIVSVNKQVRNGSSVELELKLENLFDRWYEVSVTPFNATVPGEQSFMIGPKQTLTIPGVIVNPGANIVFFTDATSSKGMRTVTFDMLHMVTMGGHLSADIVDVALDQFETAIPGSKLAVFFAKFVNNLYKQDTYELVKQITELPDLASDPALQYFLYNYLHISASKLASLATIGQWVKVGSIVVDMVEQLLLPRYGSATLVAE